MNVGAAGSLAIFFFASALAALTALIVFSYSSYSFLVALVNTAAGNDEVRWPGDAILDWFWLLFYVAWVAAVWAVPPALIASGFGLPGWLVGVAVAAVLWLTFPVGILSSLSATSRWIVFRPAIAGLMLKHFPATFGFYVATAVLWAVCGGLIYAGIRGPVPILLLPLAGVSVAVGLLIYARLLGRIGCLISWRKPVKRKSDKDRAPEIEPVSIFDPWASPEPPRKEAPDPPRPPPTARMDARRAKPTKKKKKDRGYDPWAIPPDEPVTAPSSAANVPDEDEDPLGPAKGAYQFQAVEPNAPARATPSILPETEHYPVKETYGLAEDSGSPPRGPTAGASPEPKDSYGMAPPPTGAPPRTLAGQVEVSEYEMKLAAPRRQAPPPAHPLTTGVYSFPFYSTSISAMATIALGLLAVFGLLRLLIAINPFPDMGY